MENPIFKNSPYPACFITKDTFSFTQTLTLGTPFALQIPSKIHAPSRFYPPPSEEAGHGHVREQFVRTNCQFQRTVKQVKGEMYGENGRIKLSTKESLDTVLWNAISPYNTYYIPKSCDSYVTA